LLCFAFLSFYKALRDTLDRNAIVDGKGKLILLDLLERHPRASEKKGAGVESISYGEHPTYAGTQCFMINRTDGTKEDFSFRKCIQAIFPEESKKRNQRSDDHKRKSGVNNNKRDSPNKKKQKMMTPLDTCKTGVLIRVENLPVGTRGVDLKHEVEVW
jgi:hypothetical protein